MPAEWEKHEATWLAWPKNSLTFSKEILPDAEKAYCKMIGVLLKDEKVQLLVDDNKKRSDVLKSVGAEAARSQNLLINEIPTADVWFRDYGPIFVTRTTRRMREVAFTRWKFNAWGNKYDDLLPDDGIPERLPLEKFSRFDAPMVLEGGSIDVNGLGTCITTEQCLLNKNRNPSLNKDRIEDYLKEYLGVTNLVWLKSGVVGDDTDGHIDDIARFVSKDTVVCAVEKDESDENHDALMENFELLKDAHDQEGKRLKVIPLPMPKRIEYDGLRLPASYTNFYISNNTVLVPVFHDANDSVALKTLQKEFPTRTVIGIDSVALVNGFGAIHCVTQQQPAGRSV
jgi:agmatine deiminase